MLVEAHDVLHREGKTECERRAERMVQERGACARLFAVMCNKGVACALTIAGTTTASISSRERARVFNGQKQRECIEGEPTDLILDSILPCLIFRDGRLSTRFSSHKV